MQGGDQAADKAIAGGAVQEGDEFGFEAEMLRSVKPIAQGRTWQTVLACELALRGRGLFGVMEVVEGLGGVGARPAEGLLSSAAAGVRLSRSHGSRP